MPRSTEVWEVAPGQLSSGPAWYWQAEVNGHRLTIIERPAIQYCRWYGSTNTEIIEDQRAANVEDAQNAAENWTLTH